jgi:hypothetical protein
VGSIGEVFNEPKSLATLIVLGISPEGVSFLLAYARKLRCHNLNTHCCQEAYAYDIASKSKAIKEGSATEGTIPTEPSLPVFQIPTGDVKATAYILREMKVSGTRVNPAEGHMHQIVVSARPLYPDP